MRKLHKILIVALALQILIMGGVLIVFGQQKEVVKSTQEGNKLTEASGKEGKVDNTGIEAPEVILSEGAKPVYSKGQWDPINKKDFEYDIKVTTFNVGQFYHGSTNLDVYGGQKVHEGITPERILNAYDQWQTWLTDMESDIYALQEFNPVFYKDTKANVVMNSRDVFSTKFKTLATSRGTTSNGTINVDMGLAVQNTSNFELTDVTSGYLSEKDVAVRRPYMKGYITVAGKRIAVFSVHLQPDGFGGKEARQDAAYELINLMNQEEYAIAMGDMNGVEVADYMKKAGMCVANMGEFGSFNTYEYGTDSYIDNIFTTSNIDIKFAECEKIYAAASDHYPLSAYLKIKDEAHTVAPGSKVGSDGFLEDWYRP